MAQISRVVSEDGCETVTVKCDNPNDVLCRTSVEVSQAMLQCVTHDILEVCIEHAQHSALFAECAWEDSGASLAHVVEGPFAGVAAATLDVPGF